MDKFIDALVSVIQPPWSYLVGVAALLIVAGPKLVELRNNWLNLRLGRAQLELEKLRLEILKLRIDIGQLAAQKERPDVARELETLAVAPASDSTPKRRASKRHPQLARLIARHLRVGKALTLVAQVLLAYLFVNFAVLAVVFPFIGWTNPEFGPATSLGLAVFYGAVAWAFYAGFAAVRSVRKEASDAAALAQ